MSWLFLLQLVVPVVLVSQLAFFPLRQRAGFLLQALATLLALIALAFNGMWLFPPWWFPWLMLLVASVVVALRGRTLVAPATAVSGWRARLPVFGFAVLGVFALSQLALTWQGRSPRASAVAELAFPLESGRYLIINGGSTLAINAHLRTLDSGFEQWRGQSYGLDIVAIDALGLRATGLLPRAAHEYHSYGVKVLAPCDGSVLQALDTLPDLPVPQVDREHVAGNYLLLGCGDYEVLLGHLQPGSLQVGAGAQVTTGQHLAAIGNTGNSNEPHLHIHAQLPGAASAPIGGTPLHLRLAGRFLVRNQRVIVR